MAEGTRLAIFRGAILCCVGEAGGEIPPADSKQPALAARRGDERGSGPYPG